MNVSFARLLEFYLRPRAQPRNINMKGMFALLLFGFLFYVFQPALIAFANSVPTTPNGIHGKLLIGGILLLFFAIVSKN